MPKPGERVAVVLVSDPGPDPDDVKVLLVLGVLHKLGRVSLLAVVANGGGQPWARAALARCVLDHMGVDVPVGVGSAGVSRSALPHEFALDGAEAAGARLQDGHELLLRTLRGAPAKSVRVVLISSLRDFADVIAEDPAALASVHTVAIQGGLIPDPSRPSGWRADSSVNNVFDMDAAERVYAHCFETGLRMTVTSRHAVPLLPMQLARSFAERTNCPVMAYLAAAQSLGLEGLWVKLCEGQLPERCTKQWYFATFCGEDARQFEANQRGRLGRDAVISQYLNGYVKPYDVIAVMTILPFCAHFFDELGQRPPLAPRAAPPASALPQGAHVIPVPAAAPPAAAPPPSRMTPLSLFAAYSQPPPPAHHLLLLTSQDELPQTHVLNLLRDTYHEVILATRETQRASLSEGGGAGARGKDGAQRRSSARRISDWPPSARQADGQPRLSELHLEESLRGNFGVARPVLPGVPARKRRWLPQLRGPADRREAKSASLAMQRWAAERSLPLEPAELTRLLEGALQAARVRTRSVVTVATVASLSITVFAFCSGVLDKHFTSLSVGIPGATVAQMHDADEGWALRAYFYTGFSAIGASPVVLSLSPLSTDLPRARLVSVVLTAACCSFGFWVYAPNLARLQRTAPDEYTNIHHQVDVQRRPAAWWHAAWMCHAALRLLMYTAMWLVAMVYCCCCRASARSAARALCVTLGVHLMLNGALDIAFNCALSLSARGSTLRSAHFWPSVIAFGGVMIAIGLFVLQPSTRILAQRLFARMGGRGVQSQPEAALAAIIGYGSSLDVCDPPTLVDFALQVFEPAELTAASLTKMGPVLFASPDELRRARSQWRAQRNSRSRHTSAAMVGHARSKELLVSPELRMADCYVVHAPLDDARGKLDALVTWVAAFEVEHGRPPLVWLAPLCVDPSLSDVELLEHMPAYLARSERLLLLATSHGIALLRNAVECYVFRALGGRVANIDIAAVVGTSSARRSNFLSSGEEGGGESRGATKPGSIVSAFDTFHAMFTHTRDESIEVRARLLQAVELVSVGSFNTVVREAVPRARLAVANSSYSTEQPAPAPKGSKGGSPVRPSRFLPPARAT